MELVLPQAGKMTHALKKAPHCGALFPHRCGGEGSAVGAARIKGDILFREREYPLWNPKRKAFDWQSLA